MGNFLSAVCNLFCQRTPPMRWPCPAEYVEQLQMNTTLSLGQIQYLYQRFCLIGEFQGDQPPKHLLKRHFLSVGNLMQNPLLSTILYSMFGEKKVLSFVDFATYLSLFQGNSLNTKKEQIDLAMKKKCRLLFNMYDWDHDGRISREEIIKVVHKLYADVISQEEILHITNIIIAEMDTSHTNQILFDDFCASLARFDMSETLVTRIPETKISSLRPYSI